MSGSRKILAVVIVVCIVCALCSCSKDDGIIPPQDNNLFFGGISAGMKERDAVKASDKSLWFEGKVDNYFRSVRRAKVSCAEFTYSSLPLSGENTVTPRISVDENGKVIMIASVISVGSSEYDRTVESYEKEFIKTFNLSGLEYVSSEETSVKQIGEKSVFRTATKLFYDESVKSCSYWFDKTAKTGYAMYETGSEIAFLQFKY